MAKGASDCFLEAAASLPPGTLTSQNHFDSFSEQTSSLGWFGCKGQGSRPLMTQACVVSARFCHNQHSQECVVY